jgi:hypothetical protein
MHPALRECAKPRRSVSAPDIPRAPRMIVSDILPAATQHTGGKLKLKLETYSRISGNFVKK